MIEIQIGIISQHIQTDGLIFSNIILVILRRRRIIDRYDLNSDFRLLICRGGILNGVVEN
ncbi:hypothetical protein SDC9_192803 [bioreactor metagenome]|uniref:Uncharacterized protein n=1 Tax=bioreactor metagenome TaxID=1076179 RepID=A0A645I2Z4_9ZZZZ